ncbi:MAG: beta-ketoacyl-ACP synthase II [Rickettsiales bacterium]|nr:beta-ketoacyl-ACP synthase II [Rickettsiales bacterium]
MRRVVITGLGLVTPLGCGISHVWQQLIAGKSGIGRITRFDTTDFVCQIAGEVPRGDAEGDFNADTWIAPKEQKKMDLFIQYGIAAAVQAVEDAGWTPEDESEQDRTGVLIGSGIGGLPLIEETVLTMKEKGPKRVSPFFIPASLINLTSGHVSMRYGFRGPNHSVVTACSTGAHAIGDATRLIQHGDADVMIAGSSEGALSPVGVAGFAAARALCTSYNDRPTEGSRPWDKNRDGFVMGEGAGVVVLEEYEHAKKRGAKIYAEVAGYGLSGDAYHITSPHPEGRGGKAAMRAALKNAEMNPEEIDYINAHGTSTPMGDMIELNAVKSVFGDAAMKLSMSSTKSAIAHLLGGAGSVEAIFCVLAMQHGVVPPTLNLHDPDEGSEGIDLVPLKSKERPVRAALSNSFGFGGTNASLILKQV